jgi:hypothetical protein
LAVEASDDVSDVGEVRFQRDVLVTRRPADVVGTLYRLAVMLGFRNAGRRKLASTRNSPSQMTASLRL